MWSIVSCLRKQHIACSPWRPWFEPSTPPQRQYIMEALRLVLANGDSSNRIQIGTPFCGVTSVTVRDKRQKNSKSFEAPNKKVAGEILSLLRS